jgi:hypothetical protein
MPAPIEHFSPILHYAGPGAWVSYVAIGLLILGIAGAIGVGAALIQRWGRLWLRLAATCCVGGMLYGGFALLSFLSDHQGKLQWLVIEEGPRGRVVRATFSHQGSKSSSVSQRVYGMDGALLGSRSRGGSQWYKVEGEVGGALLIRDDEDLLLIDRYTLEDIADVGDMLDDAYGEGQYKLQRVTAEGVEVLRKSGQVEAFDLARSPEGAHGAPTVTAWSPTHPDRCATDALDYRDDHKAALRDLAKASGLLRPRVVNSPTTSSNALPCLFEVKGQQAALVLCRSTAFGDDGGFALAAVAPGSPQPPLWTVDLSPAVGPYEVKALRLLDVRQPEPSALCLWMVRSERSMSEVCLDAATGALQQAKVIF